MKKFFVLIFAVFAVICATAQIYVKDGSFHETDQFFNMKDDMTDDNYTPLSVIKVKTENMTEQEVRKLGFGGNALTYFDAEYHGKEVWLYCSCIAEYIKFTHPDLSSFEFTLPFDMKPLQGYELVLVSGVIPDGVGKGTLILKSKPENGATIYINGVKISQTTPYTNEMLPTGVYEIKIEKERFQPVTRTVTIQHEKTEEVELEMPTNMANVKINVNKEQCTIEIDGKMVRNHTDVKLIAGKHEVEVRKNNFHTKKMAIDVVAGEDQQHDIVLKPIMGTISVKTEPVARVFIDDRDFGLTPIVNDSLEYGYHTLIIQKTDWYTIKKTFVLEQKTISFDEIMDYCPEGAVKGIFSVSAYQKVYFSKGNLQYKPSAKVFRFAENQWDHIGGTFTEFGFGGVSYSFGNVYSNGTKLSNTNVSPTYSNWIDLFVWGSGDNPTKTDVSGYKDWGSNPISNGGGMPDSWRILSQEEWNYLLFERPTKSGIRYAKIQLVADGKYEGLILLPDDWDPSYYNLKDTNNPGGISAENVITKEDFYEKLESHGVVFLSECNRMYKYKDEYQLNPGGFYWISNDRQYLRFRCIQQRSNTISYLEISNSPSGGNCAGVRLVKDIVEENK